MALRRARVFAAARRFLEDERAALDHSAIERGIRGPPGGCELRYSRAIVVTLTERAEPGADWRTLVLQRASRMLALVSVPAILVVVAMPAAPYGLGERVTLLAIAVAMVVTTWLARDARRFRGLAVFLTGSITVFCLALAARVGMGPGLALALGGSLVLVAIFFGNRAVWAVAIGTTLAILGLGAANRAGWLHPVDPAAMFDWTKTGVWVRIAAGYVAATSIAASAVAMVIAHLEESLRDRERLLVAERQAIRENVRLFEAEKRARERLGRLQQITASLARATTPDEVIEAACRTSSEAVAGHSAALWMLGADGGLRLAGSWGTPSNFLQEFRIIPMGANLPAQQVVRSGQPLWVESEEDYRASSSEMYEAARAAARVVAFCLFPLAVDGVVKGTLAFVQPIGHRFDDNERAYYTTIALHCSQALERATLHEAAREVAVRAEAANRLKDEFLSTVSHELRTPLNAITGWVHMLRSGNVPAERRDHALKVIDRNARVQAKLVADLLDVNLIRAGRLRMNSAPVEPASVLQMAIDSVRPAADEKGVRVVAIVKANEPVLGDAARLQQIICNLLTNGLKFSACGGRVEVTLEHDPPDVVITVRDDGEGIKPEFLPSLFEPFRQAEGGFARSHGGLGLGLTITKKLVELHGGTIRAHSDGEACGATFVVRLPSAFRRAAAGLEALSSEPKLTAGRELRGLRVLLVEDEPDTRELLLAIFALCGAQGSGAASAAEAMDLFDQARPDVIVSDVGLPGEDGLTFLRKVRSLPGGDVPAVALTAFVRPEDREEVLAAGFDAHVVKPVEPERLLDIMCQTLRERRARERAHA
jgi:signal transduction histidine kinase/ActR/RegA family two-component response regulator